MVYKELRASDFNKHLKESKKGSESQRQMVNLFMNLDKFALEEDIIEKGYAQFITTITCNKKEIKKAKAALKKAFETQINGTGYSFVEVLAACPTNWHMTPVDSLAHIENVIEKVHPLGVFKDITGEN